MRKRFISSLLLLLLSRNFLECSLYSEAAATQLPKSAGTMEEYSEFSDSLPSFRRNESLNITVAPTSPGLFTSTPSPNATLPKPTVAQSYRGKPFTSSRTASPAMTKTASPAMTKTASPATTKTASPATTKTASPIQTSSISSHKSAFLNFSPNRQGGQTFKNYSSKSKKTSPANTPLERSINPSSLRITNATPETLDINSDFPTEIMPLESWMLSPSPVMPNESLDTFSEDSDDSLGYTPPRRSTSSSLTITNGRSDTISSDFNSDLTTDFGKSKSLSPRTGDGSPEIIQSETKSDSDSDPETESKSESESETESETDTHLDMVTKTTPIRKWRKPSSPRTSNRTPDPDTVPPSDKILDKASSYRTPLRKSRKSSSPKTNKKTPDKVPPERTSSRTSHRSPPKKSKRSSPPRTPDETSNRTPADNEPSASPSLRDSSPAPPSNPPEISSPSASPPDSLETTDPGHLRENLVLIQRLLLVSAAATFIGIVLYSIYYINMIRNAYEKELVSD